MDKWDVVVLKDEVEGLASRGIHKGYTGTIIEIDGDEWTIWFSNPHNHGEYAFAKVNKKYFDFWLKKPYPSKLFAEMQEFIAGIDMKKYSRLTECDVREYDKVALAVEKYEYAREGVHKGDEGCVFGEYAIDGEWWICFTVKENGKFKDVELNVKREDFIIVE